MRGSKSSAISAKVPCQKKISLVIEEQEEGGARRRVTFLFACSCSSAPALHKDRLWSRSTQRTFVVLDSMLGHKRKWTKNNARSRREFPKRDKENLVLWPFL